MERVAEPDAPAPPARLLRAARFGAACAGIGLTLATLLGFAGAHWWGFDLLAHLRVQYALALALLAIAQMVLRPAKWAGAWGIALAVNLACIAPAFAPQSRGHPDGPPASDQLRLLHLNLDRGNQDVRSAIQLIEAHDAQLIFLQELTPAWHDALSERLNRFRIELAEPRKDTRGVAMLVQRENPLTVRSRIIQLRPDLTDRPMLEATVHREDREEIAILSLHVKRPTGSSNAAIQQSELAAAAAWASGQHRAGRSVIIIGDFNSTPWSSRFRRLLREGALVNSQAGFGIQPTWPAAAPWPLRIPIDHCLHSEDLAAIERRIGPPIGSDHLPLSLTLRPTNSSAGPAE